MNAPEFTHQQRLTEIGRSIAAEFSHASRLPLGRGVFAVTVLLGTIVSSWSQAHTRGYKADEMDCAVLTRWLTEVGEGRFNRQRPSSAPNAPNPKAVYYALGIESGTSEVGSLVPVNGGGSGSAVIGLTRLGNGTASARAEAKSPTPRNPFAATNAGDEFKIGGVRLCWCPPGKFTMGSPRSEPERRPGEDQVEVTLTKGFWMSKFEATQADWKRVIGKLPGPLTSELPEGDLYPVGNVNFAEAERFCQRLTEISRQSGELPMDWEFRLPTEAQWEYACRAGTTTATSFGDKLSSKQANFKGKPYNGGEPGPSLGRAAKVGGYPANAWGLHDMHGNIFEWCRDWFHTELPGGIDPDLYTERDSAQRNRTGDASRSRRGGAWVDDGWPCRSAFRLRFEPARRYDHIGFRVVVVQP